MFNVQPKVIDRTDVVGEAGASEWCEGDNSHTFGVLMHHSQRVSPCWLALSYWRGMGEALFISPLSTNGHWLSVCCQRSWCKHKREGRSSSDHRKEIVIYHLAQSAHRGVFSVLIFITTSLSFVNFYLAERARAFLRDASEMPPRCVRDDFTPFC